MKHLNLTALLISLSVVSTPAQSALVNLSQTPLGLSTSVTPNVFFQIDDSGSMDWEILMNPYWEACAYDSNYPALLFSNTCGTQWSGDEGLIGYGNLATRQFGYIYNNAENIYNIYNPTGCGYNAALPLNAIGACTINFPIPAYTDWRGYTADANVVYYTPDITYYPWVYNCTSGTACTDASFSSARENPVQGQTGYTNTRNLAGGKYEVWIDDKGFSGTRPLRGTATNATTTPNGEVDLWDSHVTFTLNANNIKVDQTICNPAPTFLPLPGNNMNCSTTTVATLAGNTCHDVLGPSSNVTAAFTSGDYKASGGSGCQTIAQAQQNFANWYQYNRRRSANARASIAYVVDQYPNFRYGMNTINDKFFVQVPPSSATTYTSYNTAMLKSLMDYAWQPLGTPNRSGLDRVGMYYKNSLSGMTNPITQACQQNFTIFLTDGYYNLTDTLSITPGINDVDGDGLSKTFADVAYYYYKDNLQTSFTANQVPPNNVDPATWLHMVTFTMSFGLQGNLVAGTDGWPTPALAINGNWGDPFTNNAAKADDLWHAAFNSKGAYLKTQVPALASAGLGSFLSTITQRAVSSASAAQNATVLNATSAVYQATFNSNNWSGDVLSYSINVNGQLATAATWSANCLLTGGICSNPIGTFTGTLATNRKIITRNWTGANNGIAFRWPSNYSTYKVSGKLPTNMANFLSLAPYPANTNNNSQKTANQNYGAALLNYLRGDRANEASKGASYSFRDRTSILGDIINSGPLYVGSPSRNYTDSLEASAYSTFKTTYASRTPLIYVGGNDGMLHGFNANTGAELIAYIPGIRQNYQNLPNLSATAYPHYYFVDGTPVEADVYTGGQWRTILVNTMRNGGQGIFALDITNPNNFSEANASSLYLWEFTDQDDPDVGYAQGSVTIAKVKTGATTSEWAVIFGNGYNTTQADGFASTTGKPTLFILMINRFSGTWTLNSNYYKIQVGTGSVATPNGLSPAYAVDTNGNFVVDYVYAGDQLGNMWNFNLTSATPASWSGSILFNANFSTAGDQPITAPPVVGPHPNGISYGVMVYFGTGMYLQPSDNSTTAQVTQAYYGIWDKLAGATVAKSSLIQQQILGQATGTNGATYRLVSNNSINFNPAPPAQNLGWYVNLIETSASSNYGERQVSPGFLRNGNVIFTTVIPSTNPCAPGGSSWLMELNSINGGTDTIPTFDTTGDGKFTTADYISVTTGGVTTTGAASGVKSSVGMISTPTVFLSPDKDSETKVISGTQGLGTVTENPGTGPSGRQNWRQLYQ